MIMYIVTYVEDGNATTVCGAFEFEYQAIDYCEEKNSQKSLLGRRREYSYEEFCLGVVD